MQINSINSTSFGKLHIAQTPEMKNRLMAFSRNSFIAEKLSSSLEKINEDSGDKDVYFSIEDATRNNAKYWDVCVKDSNEEVMASFEIAKGAPNVYYEDKLKKLAERCKLHPYRGSAEKTAENIFNTYV